MAQICEFDFSNVSSSISMETQVSQERTTITWKLRNFHQFCPPGVQEFGHIVSPVFSAGTSVGKPSTWAMSVSGDKGFLSFGLNLLNLEFSELGEKSYCPSTNVSGSASLILKNAEGSLLNVTRVPKFELGPEVRAVEMQNFTSIASAWTARSDFEISNDLSFEVVLNLLGDPVGEVVERGVKRAASEQLAIEDDPDNILVECEEQGFPVHKSILSEKSKRFAAMLSPGSAGINQNKLQLHDLDAATADTLFSFIYTEDIPESLSVDEARNVLGAARTYEVKDLASRTFSVLCKDLDSDNYFEVIQLCKEFGADSETKDALESFYKKNRRVLNRRRRS